MPSSLLKQCATALANRNLTVACAESATAGRLCAELALAPESGKILKGGLVCYDATIKTTVLHIPQELLDQFTPESPEVTSALSEQLPVLIDADVYVGITGLTTHGGSETPEKPVGTIFIDVWHRQRHQGVRQVFSGTPEHIITAAVDAAAQLILKTIE